MRPKIVKITEIRQIEWFPCRILEYNVEGLSREQFERFVKALLKAGFRVFLYGGKWCPLDGWTLEIYERDSQLWCRDTPSEPLLYHLENAILKMYYAVLALQNGGAPGVALSARATWDRMEEKMENLPLGYREVVINCYCCYSGGVCPLTWIIDEVVKRPIFLRLELHGRDSISDEEVIKVVEEFYRKKVARYRKRVLKYAFEGCDYILYYMWFEDSKDEYDCSIRVLIDKKNKVIDIRN